MLEMSWQLLTALSVITFSVSVLLQRVLLHKHKSDPVAYVVMFQGSVGILFTVYALAKGFEMPDVGRFWFPMLATMVLYGVAHLVYANTLRQVEASVFTILFATHAFWLMLISVFVFDESITAQQMLGTLLIFTSVAILVERGDQLKLDKGVLLGLLTGVLFGVAGAAWAYVGKSADAASWNAISFIGPSVFILATHPGSMHKLKPFLNRDMFKRLLTLAGLFAVSALTLMLAFQRGNVSLAAPLQQTSIILTIILAVIFLNERRRLVHKAIAALVCFIGVLLIV